MNNSEFYIAAATVIPLLLIAIMATRSLRPGALQQQPASTVLVFGLPVIGELAAFSFLFFEPVPTAVAVILAVVTWVGLLSQLALAVWWLAELIRRDVPPAVPRAAQAAPDPIGAQAPAAGPGTRPARSSPSPTESRGRGTGDGSPAPADGKKKRQLFCPACGDFLPEEDLFCDRCGYVRAKTE
jgi:ribosomal protein S27AE